MTAYINLTTNEYPRHVGDIELDPVGIENYAQVTWVNKPDYNTELQRCYEGEPMQINSVWYMTWIVRDATQEEIELVNIPFDERFPT
jgi:hypothetical protein